MQCEVLYKVTQLDLCLVGIFDLVTADDAILQFGKSSEDEYVLDFKHPMSPLQAFGIALSTYIFAGVEEGDGDIS